MNPYLLATQLSTHIKLFLNAILIFPSVFLQTHNPSCNQTLDSFAELSSPLQSHITSSNERKLLDHPTTNIFSWCCSPLTTHHSSSCNNLNISLSKYIYLLSLNITTFTLMKFYIANINFTLSTPLFAWVHQYYTSTCTFKTNIEHIFT